MAIIPHKRFDDKTNDYVECDGNMIDVTTLVDRDRRFLCSKCRTIKLGGRGAVDEEVIGEEASRRPVPPPGILKRILKAFLG